jgi:two-component system, sensor histidine kinase and response regulator
LIPQAAMFAWADYAMITTIMRNLVSNALKFTHAGGAVSLSASLREHAAEVTVTDTGCGIPPDGLAKLFRIDATYSGIGTDGEQGTGLGLILCKELVELQNGRIWVESAVGKGTTFRFTIPKASEEKVAPN